MKKKECRPSLSSGLVLERVRCTCVYNKASRHVHVHDCIVSASYLWYVNKVQLCCFKGQFWHILYILFQFQYIHLNTVTNCLRCVTVVHQGWWIVFGVKIHVGRRARYRSHFRFTLFVANYWTPNPSNFEIFLTCCI